MTDRPETFPQTLNEFNEFFTKNQDGLLRHAFFRLGNKEEAEDMVQEVMIKFYLEKERKQHIEQPVSYVFRMVYNACIDQMRKNIKTNFESLEKNDSQTRDDSNRETEIIAEEEFHRINQLLMTIPSEQAEVLRLRAIDELSFVEIAKLLKLPVTTIKSRFIYGITKLKTKLTKKEEVKNELH